MKIVNKSDNPNPEYATRGSAGFDIRSNEDIYIMPLQRALIKTGLFFEVPNGLEAQVRPRSGLAIKHGITVLNTPGTIDSDYRGEVGVILYNAGHVTYSVKKGDRIAQVIIAPYHKVDIEAVDALSETIRGEDGFGSTGR